MLLFHSLREHTLLHDFLLFSQSEIPNLQHVALVNEYVCRLYVPVDETFLVDMFQSAQQLSEHLDVESPVNGSLLIIQDVLKRHSRTVLHLDHDIQGYETALQFYELYN